MKPERAEGRPFRTVTDVRRSIAGLQAALNALQQQVGVISTELEAPRNGGALRGPGTVPADTAKRVVQNSILRVGGYAVGAALQFAVIVLAARYLGPEGFGNFALILAIAGSVQLMADMGVRNILIRDIAVDPVHFAERLGVARTLLWSLSVVALGLIILLANLLTWSTEMREAIYLAGLAVVVTLFGLGYSAVLRAFEEMGWDILGFVLHKVAFIGLVWMVIQTDRGLRGLFGAMLAANGLLYLYHRVLVRVLHGPPRVAFQPRVALRMLAESAPLGAAELLRRLTWQVDKLLLAVLATPVAVGLFGAAFKLFEATSPFTTNLTLPLFPVFSRVAKASPARMMQVCEQSLKVLHALGIPLAILLFVLSDRIVELFFGRTYGEAALVLRVIAPAVFLLLPTSVYGYAFTALGRQRDYTVCVVVALVTKVVMELLLIPRYGHLGAAVGTLAAEIALYLGGLLMLRRLGTLPIVGLIWRPALAGLAMSAICWFARDVPPLRVPVGLLAGGLAYAALLLRPGTFTPEQRTLLRHAIRVRFGGAAQ